MQFGTLHIYKCKNLFTRKVVHVIMNVYLLCGCESACVNTLEHQKFCPAEDYCPLIAAVCNWGSAMQAHKLAAPEPLGNNTNTDFSEKGVVEIIIL